MKGSGGNRIEWTTIDADVRAAVEASLGATVAAAENQDGGFSPGLAARCTLDDGRRVFIKAVSRTQNPHAPRIHRREIEVAGLLPTSVPAPRLHTTHDDGNWVVLVFDQIDGTQPDEPWNVDQLDVVCRAIADLGVHTPPPDVFQSVAARHGGAFTGLRDVADGTVGGSGLDPWVIDNLDTLAALESRWEAAAHGDTLLHTDIRADNVLLTDDGVVFVDWPWASVGARFIDPLFFLPSVGLGGGPKPAEVAARHGFFDGVPDDAVNAVLAAVTGFFVVSALAPPPPGLPTLRAFQAAQGVVALDWLQGRLDT